MKRPKPLASELDRLAQLLASRHACQSAPRMDLPVECVASAGRVLKGSSPQVRPKFAQGAPLPWEKPCKQKVDTALSRRRHGFESRMGLSSESPANARDSAC